MSGTLSAAIDRVAANVRRRVLLHTIEQAGGYLCQACCSAEALAALYLGMMRLGPSVGPRLPARFAGVPGSGREVNGGAYNGRSDPDHDRFLLSPAHYALPLYATLIEVGRLDEAALDEFNKDGSTVEMIGAEHSPGFAATTGSLGQALSVGIGMAMARRRRGDSGRVWVYMSDGELQEGQTWEALQVAGHHGVDNLGVVLDANGSQVDGNIEEILSIEPIADRLRAFGWTVKEVDGHNARALLETANELGRGKPVAVVARTQPWHGIESLRERAPRLHYVRLNVDEAQSALRDVELAQGTPA